MRRRRFLAVTVLALAGCASLPPGGIPARPSRQTVAAFQIEGRLGVRRGEESFSANLFWQHGPDSDEIVLTSPLGQGLARLAAGNGSAVLETANRRRFEAASLEELSEQVFGFRLPVTALPHWIVGRAAGPGAAVERDAQGRLVRLSEQEWAVELAAYESDSPDALPSLVQLARDDVRVRLKIDQWSLSP
ncbi:MAG: lipoprotein insertase outer membrane protein LolB [Pseudomonadota bacterium]|jgi:outer membrane lipoprotein LolB